MLVDINKATQSSNPSYLTNINGTVFFMADGKNKTRQVWKTNGTATGTKKIADFGSGSAAEDPQPVIAFNGSLYYAAHKTTGVDYGVEVWKTNPAGSSTTLLADIKNSAEALNVG